MQSDKPFWQTKSLLEMSHDEWESVCDGCAKCCLNQLHDEEVDELVFTDVACQLLDGGTCRCKDYDNRSKKVPHCVELNAENIFGVAEFAPPSCAYRLLLMGEELPQWHHLNSGSRNTVHETGNSVKGRVRFIEDITSEDLQEYIVEWPKGET